MLPVLKQPKYGLIYRFSFQHEHHFKHDHLGLVYIMDLEGKF